MKIRDRILIVEDDQSIVNLLRAVLKADDYDVLTASTEKEAESVVSSQCPDLVLLDLGLPDADGIGVLQFVRGYSTMPVIVVSARDHEKDKVEALDLGADDYIAKPFGTSELLARVRTALRHHRMVSTSPKETQVLTVGDGRLKIDYAKHRVFLGDCDCDLTQNEYKIVALLGKYAGRVMTYDFIMKEIWGPHLKEDNRILRVNMANIRRKIEENPARPEFLFTETGVGYRLLDSD